MDILFSLLGLMFILFGLAGSLLPIIPGPPLSWIGLLFLYMTTAVPNDTTFLVITGIVAIAIFTLDYFIPAIGTKRFGGSRSGVIGLFIGLFSPIPGGIIIGPFVGAFIGEKYNNANNNQALKAAFGSFLGFITGTLLKFIVAIVYFGYFIATFWEYKHLMV